MRFSETLGTLLGYPLGVLTGTVSFMRGSRMFHPTGILVRGTVKNLSHADVFPPDALLRFSSAWWKKKEWRDVLGIAIRFDERQDLLFASFEHSWQTPIGPFLTKYHDFFENNFYAVSRFRFQGKVVYFKLEPKLHKVIDAPRDAKLREQIRSHSSLSLLMREEEGPWTELAEIELREEVDLDQSKLRFDPFLNGLGIYPEGFIHHLRIGAYRLGQIGRALR